MNDPIIRRWINRSAWRIVLIPVFALLPIGIFLCLALFGAGMGEVLGGGRDTGSFFFIFGLCCFVVLAIFGGLGLGFYLRNRNHQIFNDVFLSFGFEGSGYLLSGRQYKGSYGGRQVNVYVYATGSRYNRRPIMELFVEAPVGGRIGIGTENVLSNMAAGLLSKDALEGTGLDENLDVFADDTSWALSMLDARGVRGAIATLMETIGNYEIRVINYMPDSIRLRLTSYTREALSQEYIRSLLDGLLTLANAAADGPRPSTIVEPTETEIKSRTDRTAFLPLAFGIAAGIVILLGGSFVCMVLVVFWLINV